MAQDQPFNAMRKMIRTVADDAGQTSTENAITLAMARVGQNSLGLSLNIVSAHERQMTLSDMPEIIPDHSLRLIIEGAKETTGLMALDPDMMGAVTQMQTMGKLCRISPAQRHPTRLDASMAMDFVDATLTAIEQELSSSAELGWAGGFRYASWIEESRPLETVLEEIPYRVWTLKIRLGNGDLHGVLIWIIPHKGRGVQPKQVTTTSTPHDADWADKLSHNVMESRVAVDAVLHRLTMPLSTLMGLRAGMDLLLPSATLGDIRLESQKRQLSNGRLGQTKGQRAILLTAAAPETAPEVHEPLAILKIA